MADMPIAQYADRDIRQRFNILKSRYAERDARMGKVASVRGGNYDEAFPGLFPSEWPKPIVANFIDTVARDLSEVIAPLPTFSCSQTNMTDDSKRTKAEKRTIIANSYISESKLGREMYAGADQYITYGFLPFRVEPNFKDRRPHITVEDPMGSYPEFDRWGNCTAFARRFLKPTSELCAMFPEYADKLKNKNQGQYTPGDTMLEVVRWVDDKEEIMFVPERSDLILAQTNNPLGRCPVVVARKPSFDGQQRGQFDDVLWVQMARAKFALLSLEAAHKAVEAPLFVPSDIQHFPIGGDAIIRTREPQNVRRAPIEMPQSAFAQAQSLDQEMRNGARYPEGRQGNIDASVITGRGVQALMGGFDTQIKTAQDVLADTFVEVIAMCFEMDVKLFPLDSKEIKGQQNGNSYTIKYVPQRDIGTETGVEVTYGLMAGLDPNRALVWSLQALGADLVSKSFVRRNLPNSMNVKTEEELIDVERLREAGFQGVAAYVQSIPAMAAQGQDPTEVVTKLALIIESRKKGVPIETAIAEAFAPPPPPPSPQTEAGVAGQQMPNELGSPGMLAPEGNPSGMPPGMQETGLPQGVAPGQAGMAPGGRPDMQTLLAGLSASGAPNLSASVVRRQPA